VAGRAFPECLALEHFQRAPSCRFEKTAIKLIEIVGRQDKIGSSAIVPHMLHGSSLGDRQDAVPVEEPGQRDLGGAGGVTLRNFDKRPAIKQAPCSTGL
jgi:hypothetical protein